jgi:rRNA maturation endonuclease Nob1
VIAGKKMQNIMNEKYKCEMCNKNMTEENHNFCDICDDCREENEL